MKERLDILLVKRNLAASREKAKAIIMSGSVFVDGQREDKAGATFPEEAAIEVRGHTLPYVSRGGLKLGKGASKLRCDGGRKSMHRRWLIHRGIHGLHASEWGPEGLCHRCGKGPAGLEIEAG